MQRRGSTAQQVRLVALGNEERTNEHGGEDDPPPHRKSEVGAGRFGRRRRRRDWRLALPANALVVRVVLTAGWTVHKQSRTENWAKSVERIVTRVSEPGGRTAARGFCWEARKPLQCCSLAWFCLGSATSILGRALSEIHGFGPQRLKSSQQFRTSSGGSVPQTAGPDSSVRLSHRGAPNIAWGRKRPVSGVVSSNGLIPDADGMLHSRRGLLAARHEVQSQGDYLTGPAEVPAAVVV